MQTQTVSQTIIKEEFSPPLLVDLLYIGSRKLYVVRDDLLPGGTKQRACAPYLEELARKGHRKFIYASPFAGFAQVALSYVCQRLGFECIIVCEEDPAGGLHSFSKLAASYGAKVHSVSTLDEAEWLASRVARVNKSIKKLPLGFDCPEFKAHLAYQISNRWNDLKFLGTPKNIWVPVGSGTLAKTFCGFLPASISLQAVDVRVLNSTDRRILELSSQKRVSLRQAPVPFHEPAAHLPEIPSNLFYDAKLWEFIVNEAENGDIWWNVAR